MSVYSIPVTIGVDEEKIVKTIEKDVEDRVVENVTKEIKEIIYERTYYGKDTNEPLRQMIHSHIQSILQSKEEFIVSEAAAILAEKMIRTKAVKEAIKKVVESTKIKEMKDED